MELLLQGLYKGSQDDEQQVVQQVTYTVFTNLTSLLNLICNVLY